MKTKQPAPVGAVLPDGSNFAGYRAKVSEITFLDFTVKLNKLCSYFFPENREETEEMKSIIFQEVASKSKNRMSYTAYSDDLSVSVILVCKKGGIL